MDFNIIPHEEVMDQCAWCRNYITDDMEVFGAGAELKPGIDLSEYEKEER